MEYYNFCESHQPLTVSKTRLTIAKSLQNKHGYETVEQPNILTAAKVYHNIKPSEQTWWWCNGITTNILTAAKVYHNIKPSEQTWLCNGRTTNILTAEKVYHNIKPSEQTWLCNCRTIQHLNSSKSVPQHQSITWMNTGNISISQSST